MVETKHFWTGRVENYAITMLGGVEVPAAGFSRRIKQRGKEDSILYSTVCI